MEITRTARAEYFELKLKGRMDAIWSDHVGRALADCVHEGQHIIAIDMAEVDYISSAGIRILVMYARQLKGIQGRLTVINGSNEVKKVLKLAGLEPLLLEPSSAAAKPGKLPAAPLSRAIELPQAGAHAELFDLDANARIQVEWVGNPQSWLEGKGQPDQCRATEFPETMLGLGLGVFGTGNNSFQERLGEFMAAAGVAICLPADGSDKPDYLRQQGELLPAVNVAYGILGKGKFARLLRFDRGENGPGLPLSSIVEACQKAVNGEAVGMVMVAETATLVGASLQQGPNERMGGPEGFFAFPAVREWLSFTAETAFANSVSLVVGFAGDKKQGAGCHLFRPLRAAEDLFGHFHAAAFPYRPIRKGKVALTEIVPPLLDNENVLGLLHLVNDWREASGAGESLFLRGACWCSPLALPK